MGNHVSRWPQLADSIWPHLATDGGAVKLPGGSGLDGVGALRSLSMSVLDRRAPPSQVLPVVVSKPV